MGPAPGFLEVPRGAIDSPAAGREVAGEFVQVLGWALFPGSTVARVEVTVGTAPAQRARLAMPRPDVAAYTSEPSAHVSGFELMAEVGARRGPVPVSAVAHSSDGRRVELDPVSFEAVPAPV
jgi:hypothetical protein